MSDLADEIEQAAYEESFDAGSVVRRPVPCRPCADRVECPPMHAKDFNLACPLPLGDHATVQMAHGGGGRLMRQLIEGMFLPAFQAGTPPGQQSPPHDSAVLQVDRVRIAFTTDTFVVSPLFFPGGDIGKLAVYGTVNDLAMAGARPAYLRRGFYFGRGIPDRHAASHCPVDGRGRAGGGRADCHRRYQGGGPRQGRRAVCEHGGHRVGACRDRGLAPPGRAGRCRPGERRPGTARHGHHVGPRGARFRVGRSRAIAPLAGLVAAMLAAGGDIHCLRDLTRGGLAAALNEIAEHAAVGIELEEAAIPVIPPVVSACELLGLDPLYVANEGRLVAFVPAPAAESVLNIMRNHPAAQGPAIIGSVTSRHPGTVELRGVLGGGRIIDLLSGEQMPRIC